MTKFFNYCKDNPYTTIVALGMLVKLTDQVLATPPDLRFSVFASGDSWSIIAGAVALLTGQDPKMLKKND